MRKPEDNIYWVTETYDNDNYISMQSPCRSLFNIPKRKCAPTPNPCSCEIDFSNNIKVENEANADIETGDISGSTVENITRGTATSSVTIDAVQVSVLVIVPIIDIETGIPVNGAGQYKVGAAGQNLDIKVNGDGTATVNGEKLNESELENGTKVYIYKNSDVKKDVKNVG